MKMRIIAICRAETLAGCSACPRGRCSSGWTSSSCWTTPSTDDTSEIVAEMREIGHRIVGLRCEGSEWPEMEHRQMLLQDARRRGTHIVTVDDDEVLTGNLVPTIRETIAAIPEGHTLQLPWLCLRGDVNTVHAGGIWGSAYASVAWQDDPRCHWSSAERGGYQYHHRHPMGRRARRQMMSRRRGGLFHLQMVDDRRLRAKQYLYQLKDRLNPTRERPTAQSVRITTRRRSTAKRPPTLAR